MRRLADKVIVVIHTIHEEIVGSGTLAIGRKTRHVALATLLATATARYRHPWVQARQLCEVAPIQRQIFDLAVVNNFAQLGTLRLSENRVALDRDGFRCSADSQHDIERAHLINADLNALLNHRGESLSFGPHFIGSIGQSQNAVGSVSSGRKLPFQPRSEAGDGNLGPGDIGALFVPDGAYDSTLSRLPPGNNGQSDRQQSTQHKQRKFSTCHAAPLALACFLVPSFPIALPLPQSSKSRPCTQLRLSSQTARASASSHPPVDFH